MRAGPMFSIWAARFLSLLSNIKSGNKSKISGAYQFA